MGNRTARFISTLGASIVAGAPLAAVSQSAPTAPSAATTPGAANTATNAAGDCLASPKGIAPQGQHWYYRLERSTKRQCWYLRAEGNKTTQSAQAAHGAPDADSSTPQTVQNAHAEYIAPQNSAATNTPNATAPAPAMPAAPVAAQQPPSTNNGNAPQTSVGTPWPDVPTAAAPPAPQPAAAPAPDAQPSAQEAAPASPAPVAPATADVPADKPTGSLQMLLLVVVGALALAGLIASIIYRFAGSRVRVQAHHDGPRRVNWDNREAQNQDNSGAPWLAAAPAAASRPQLPRAVDFDTARASATRLTTIAAELGTRLSREHTALGKRDKSTSEAIEAKTSASHREAVDTDAEEPEKPAGVDAVDVEAITAILERLAKEGPRLAPSKPEAGFADSERIQRGQSAARA